MNVGQPSEPLERTVNNLSTVSNTYQIHVGYCWLHSAKKGAAAAIESLSESKWAGRLDLVA